MSGKVTAVLCTVFIAFTFCQKKEREEVSEGPSSPNIVIFYADDLGYGDLSCYGATAVRTPAIDRLAENGVRFTDAHSSAATCTPSRYSLLTGSFAFRNNARVLPGDAPLLIDTARFTLPKMLKKAGYATGVVGKWHLGLGNGNLDWNEPINLGPDDVGFDYSFLLPATNDRVPTVFVENGTVAGLKGPNALRVSYHEPFAGEPTARKNREVLRYQGDDQHSDAIVNGVGRIGFLTGGDSALWVDEEFPDIFTEKALSFIDKNKAEPFFLFYSFSAIHAPRLPNSRFKGKTGMGVRGDAILQMDWCVEKIMDHLKKNGLEENTLVIFTSDNGPVLNDGYEDKSVELLGDHTPWGPFSGGKYSALEAGTRVPTIVNWPARIDTPSVSDALLTQTDLLASLARLVDVKLPEGEAPDSFSQLEAWLGQDTTGRKEILEESSFTLSLRRGDWKYIFPAKKEPFFISRVKNIRPGFSTTDQLYDLSNDVKEENNLATENPEVTHSMKERILEIRQGKSTRPQ